MAQIRKYQEGKDLPEGPQNLSTQPQTTTQRYVIVNDKKIPVEWALEQAKIHGKTDYVRNLADLIANGGNFNGATGDGKFTITDNEGNDLFGKQKDNADKSQLARNWGA